MGIPLFITPIEPEVASKAAEKTAARPRSSIRRLRPVGHPRMSPETRRRRIIGRFMEFDRLDDFYVVEPNTQGGAPPRDDDITPASLPSGRPYHSNTSPDYERMRLRDQLSFERQRTGNSDNESPSLPPAPESEDFNARELDVLRQQSERQLQRSERLNQQLLQARRRQDLRRMARRRAAPTPPYLEGDTGFWPRSNRSEPEERRSVLSSAMSSSRRISERPSNLHDGPLGLPTVSESISRSIRYESSPAERIAALNRARETFEAADRDALAERVAALNRATDSFEARRRSRRTPLDGLGDRDRSLSPEGATWDTLLSSITPDPQPPSAASSFASSAAAAASSSGSGPTSTHTSMTSVDEASVVESVHITPNDYCEASDSASATEDEDEDEADIYELREYGRPHRNVIGRSYANALLADRAARYNDSTDTEHWEGMHRIISRLTERDDIPDSWWASAGLSRNLRREPSA